MSFERRLHKALFESTWGDRDGRDSWKDTADDEKNALADLEKYVELRQTLKELERVEGTKDVRNAIDLLPSKLQRAAAKKPVLVVRQYKEHLLERLPRILRVLRRNLDKFPRLKEKYDKIPGLA